jgi:hypothetical protein
MGWSRKAEIEHTGGIVVEGNPAAGAIQRRNLDEI